jgi:hypothetical protein
VPDVVPAVVPTAQVEAGQDVVGDFPHVNGLDVDVPSDLEIATQVVGEELEGIIEALDFSLDLAHLSTPVTCIVTADRMSTVRLTWRLPHKSLASFWKAFSRRLTYHLTWRLAHLPTLVTSLEILTKFIYPIRGEGSNLKISDDVGMIESLMQVPGKCKIELSAFVVGDLFRPWTGRRQYSEKHL